MAKLTIPNMTRIRSTQGKHLSDKVKANEDHIKQHDQNGDNDDDR